MFPTFCFRLCTPSSGSSPFWFLYKKMQLVGISVRNLWINYPWSSWTQPRNVGNIWTIKFRSNWSPEAFITEPIPAVKQLVNSYFNRRLIWKFCYYIYIMNLNSYANIFQNFRLKLNSDPKSLFFIQAYYHYTVQIRELGQVKMSLMSIEIIFFYKY